MEQLDKKATVKLIISNLIICAGTFLMAFGNMAFVNPYNIVPGGFTGFAIILNKTILPMFPPGMMALAMNVPLFLAALKVKGKRYSFMSLVGTISYSVFTDLIPLLKIDMADVTAGNELLAVIYGGVCMGIGIGIIVRQGGSTGGSDTLANIVQVLKPGFSFGTMLLLIDGFVVVLSGVAFSIKLGGIEHGVPPALFAFLVIFICAKISDYVIEGKRNSRAYYIITSDPQKMKQAIFSRLARGITSLKAKGAYTDYEKEVLLCIVLRTQSAQLKKIVFETDQKAFVFSGNVTEVYGEGFVKPELEQKKKWKKGVEPIIVPKIEKDDDSLQDTNNQDNVQE